MWIQGSRWALFCLSTIALFSAHAFAQMTVTGGITGVATDPSGQVIAGAKVTLTSEKTGETRSATTNETGLFNFVAIQPDEYSVKIEQGGFKAAQRTGIVLRMSVSR